MRGFIRSIPLLLLLLGVAVGLAVYTSGTADSRAQIPPDPFFDQSEAKKLTPDQLENANYVGAPLPHTGMGTVGLPIGQIGPEIEGKDFYGKWFKLSDYRGKVVVLDCWVDS